MSKSKRVRILRSMARLSGLSLGLLLLLLIAAGVLLEGMSPRIVDSYRRQAERAFNLDIQIQRSRLNGLTLELEGVVLQTRGGAMLGRIERIRAPLRPLEGLRGGLLKLCQEVVLQQPQLELTWDSLGHFNWSSLSLPSQNPLTSASGWQGKVVVEQASLTLRDQRQANFLARLEPLEGNVSLRTDRSWQANLGLAGELQLQASAGPQGPVALSLEFQDYSLDPWLLHPEVTRLARTQGARVRGRLQALLQANQPEQAVVLGSLDFKVAEAWLRREKLSQLQAQLKLVGRRLHLKQMGLSWRGQKLALAGTLELSDKPWIKLEVKAPHFDLAKLTEAKWVQAKVGGRAKLQALVEGPLADPSARGRLKIVGPRWAEQSLAWLEAAFEFNRQGLHLQKLVLKDPEGQQAQVSGWIFAETGADSQRRLYLKASGSSSKLAQLSPWLASASDLDVVALGTLADPVVTGTGRLLSLPGNPLGLASGGGRFWLDRASALVWDAQLFSNGGQLAVPWALLDFDSGQLTAAASTASFGLNLEGGQAQVRGVAQLEANLKSGQVAAIAHLDQGRVAAAGLPPLEDLQGWLGYLDGEVLLPQLRGQAAGDSFQVTGSLAQGQGLFFVNSDQFNPAHWSGQLPSEARSLRATAFVNHSQVSGFRLTSQGASGDVYGVGSWRGQGSWPEVFAQVSSPRGSGQLATAWEQGRLNYYYELFPKNAGVLGGGAQPPLDLGEGIMAGRGWLQGQTLVMVENLLHLPQAAPQLAFRGEGRAYSYFGPQEGPPLRRVSQWLEYNNSHLGWTGRYNLASGRLANFKVKGRQLNLAQFQSWFGPLADLPLGEARLEEALVDLEGQASGTLAQLNWQLNLRSPWTRLSRNSPLGLQSKALSWRAEAGQAGGRLQLKSWISPRPEDFALLDGGATRGEWLRAHLNLNLKSQQTTGWVKSSAFPLEAAAWFTPAWLASRLPSGVLATGPRGIALSGSLREPRLSGRLELRQGRIWTGFDYLPIDEGFADFASQGRNAELTRLSLRSAGLSLEGRGQRTPEGALALQMWADDLDLDTLARLGLDTRGWRGKLDLAASLRDQGQGAPEGWLAIEGQDLSPPNPEVFGIKRLVLGSIERQESGIPSTGPGRGLAFRYQGGEFTVQAPPKGAEVIWANAQASRARWQGQLSWTTWPRPGQTLSAWLTSPQGPRFGKGSKPLRLDIEHFGWQLLAGFFGWSPEQRQADLGGSLSLLGQFFQQHRVDPAAAGSSVPWLTAEIRELTLEGPGSAVGSWSGVRLKQPLRLAYQVLDGSGWLRLEPATLAFFRRLNAPTTTVEQGKLEFQGAMVVMENPGLKRKPASEQVAQLRVSDLPLQHLAFLLPRFKNLAGLIGQLDLQSQGPLSQPQAKMTVQAKGLQFDDLLITAVRGGARLTSTEPGRLSLDFGQGAEGLRFLLGAETDLNESLLVQGRANLDFDRDILMAGQRLQATWKGWHLSRRSDFNLSARLQDSQLRLLSILAPRGSQLSGSLQASLSLLGNSDRPELTGNLNLSNGGLIHPDLGTPLSGLNLLARFERIPLAQAQPGSNLTGLQETSLERISLDRLEGLLGSRPFRGQGLAELAGLRPTYLNFGLDADELPLDWDGLLSGRVNLHLSLTGRPLEQSGGVPEQKAGLRPFLSGRIDLPEANLTPPSQEQLQRWRGRTSNPAGWLDYDLGLNLGNDCWVSSMGSTVRGSGALRLFSQADGRPALRGELLLSRGVIRIPVYDINFRVTQGYAYFEDDLNPRIDNLRADTTLGQYQITARFDGKYPNLQADLLSNPPLPESDLRRLVGVGGLPGSSPAVSLASNAVTPDANRFLVNQGVSILSNMLTGALSEGLGRLLFASEVAFEILPTSEYVIRLAKSLNDRDTILLTFAQAIGTTRFNQTLTQYGLEWRFQPNLLTRVTLDNYGQARLWFQGVLRF